jgi:hypothetical protein
VSIASTMSGASSAKEVALLLQHDPERLQELLEFCRRPPVKDPFDDADPSVLALSQRHELCNIEMDGKTHSHFWEETDDGS